MPGSQVDVTKISVGIFDSYGAICIHDEDVLVDFCCLIVVTLVNMTLGSSHIERSPGTLTMFILCPEKRLLVK